MIGSDGTGADIAALSASCAEAGAGRLRSGTGARKAVRARRDAMGVIARASTERAVQAAKVTEGVRNVPHGSRWVGRTQCD